MSVGRSHFACGAWSPGFLWFAVFLLLSGFAAHSAERVLPGAGNGLALAAQSAPGLPDKINRLRGQASKDGTVRVVVGLSVAFAPEGLLRPADAARQRIDIAGTQDALLAKLPSVAARAGHGRKFAAIPFVVLTLTPVELEAVLAMAGLTSIEEDLKLSPSLWYSLPLLYGGTLWEAGFSGAGQAVAVLDSGVDNTHPFLNGKVVSEACFSTSDASYASVCPGGVPVSTAAGSGRACDAPGCAHGTHVAGIAAGKAGVTSAPPGGVAKDASLIAMQVFTKYRDQSACDGFNFDGTPQPGCIAANFTDVLYALDRVYALSGTLSIAAVNMSIGANGFARQCDAVYPSIKAAIDNLRSSGIATVVASGNDGYINATSFPACISSAVSVGATFAHGGTVQCPPGGAVSSGATDYVACFSNSASFLSLLAPGALVTSSVPGAPPYAQFSGTSMAAPHVAGAWAVLKQKNPAASVADVSSVLDATGFPIIDSRNGVLKKRIDVRRALDAVTGPSQLLTVTVQGSGSVTSSPAGIDCAGSAPCSALFPAGTVVTLTASRGLGTFLRWQGDCSGSDSCVVSMTAPRSVTALITFGYPLYRLSIEKGGAGTGLVSGAGSSSIHCGLACSELLSPVGAAVTLKAAAEAGSVFTGWQSTVCSGTVACTFNMPSQDTVVKAGFARFSGGIVTEIDSPGLFGGTASAQYASLTVPAGASNLVFETSGGSGDADLYVRRGQNPTTSSFDWASEGPTTAETIAIANPQAGTYYVLLYGFRQFSDVRLTVRYQVSGASGSNDIINIINLLLLN